MIHRQRTLAASASLLAVITAAAACTEEPKRTEPAQAKAACWLADMVCHQQPGPKVIDGTDPLWAYCHWLGPSWMPSRYASGVAEFYWTYRSSGEIDRIDMSCDDEESDFAILAERDATDRVVRWSYTTPRRGAMVYPARDHVYDPDGMLVEASSAFFDEGEEIFRQVWSFDYRDDGNVREVRNENAVRGTLSYATWELVYDGADLARLAVSYVEGCEEVSEYERENGRVTRMVQTAPCFVNEGRREFTYEWSDDQLRHGDALVESPRESFTEETRYTYEDGRIAEVQRDRDGQPLATYWLDYDDEGRLTHLLWWGHVPGPEDSQTQ